MKRLPTNFVHTHIHLYTGKEAYGAVGYVYNTNFEGYSLAPARLSSTLVAVAVDVII